MKMINLSKREFTKLKPLVLSEDIFNAEGVLFDFEYKGDKKVLKRLNKTNGPVFANKLYSLECLNFNKEYIPNNFIVPDYLVGINNEVEAFAMNRVVGSNLSTILNDSSIDLEEKKYYLKRIGQVLEQMNKIRTYTPLKDFFIGDLHEDNFVVNLDQKEIYVVDLDSCKIAGNKSSIAKYLTPAALLNNVNGKYKTDIDSSYFTSYVVDYNTDIYCYVIVILKYLYNGRINNVSLTEFYNFINYLNDIGVDFNLLECFNKILSNAENENPTNYIDSLTSREVALARTYTRRYK